MTEQEKAEHDLRKMRDAKVGDTIRLYRRTYPELNHFEQPIFHCWSKHYDSTAQPSIEYYQFDRVADQGWRRVK